MPTTAQSLAMQQRLRDAETMKRQAERVEELEVALREAIEWLDTAPIDYTNGNTHNGMDEGNVYGWAAHHRLVKALRQALGEEAEEGDELEG